MNDTTTETLLDEDPGLRYRVTKTQAESQAVIFSGDLEDLKRQWAMRAGKRVLSVVKPSNP